MPTRFRVSFAYTLFSVAFIFGTRRIPAHNARPARGVCFAAHARARSTRALHCSRRFCRNNSNAPEVDVVPRAFSSGAVYVLPNEFGPPTGRPGVGINLVGVHGSRFATDNMLLAVHLSLRTVAATRPFFRPVIRRTCYGRKRAGQTRT